MKKLTILFVLFTFSLLTNSYTHKQEIVRKGSYRIFYPSLTMRGEIYSHPNQEERTKDSLCFAEIVEYLAANEDWVFELTRHTDSRGSEEANLKLSQLQAENFKNSLVKKLKVDGKQLIPVGKGENEPLISDSIIQRIANYEVKEKAHQINRRFELRALKKISRNGN